MVRYPIGWTNVPGSSVSTLDCRHHTEDRLRVIRSGPVLLSCNWVETSVSSLLRIGNRSELYFIVLHIVPYAEKLDTLYYQFMVYQTNKEERFTLSFTETEVITSIFIVSTSYYFCPLPIFEMMIHYHQCFHAYPWIEADPIDETVCIPNRSITHKKGSKLSAFPHWVFLCFVLFLPDTWQAESSFRMFYSMTRAGLTVSVLSHLSLLYPWLSTIGVMLGRYSKERVPCQYRPVMIVLIYPYLLFSALIS